MSRIDDLIREYCPDGVTKKTLNEITIKPEKLVWENREAKTAKYIDLSSVNRKTGQISDLISITEDDCPSRAQQIVKENDVLFGTTRPLLKRVAYIPNILDNEICSTGFCVLRSNTTQLIPRFLFHCIRSNDFYSHIEDFQSGASYPSISDKNVKSYKIPIPPLPVQDEIVRILDSFTQLEAELEAELEARRKQYEYYRDSLLNFENLETRLGGGRARFLALGEMSDTFSGLKGKGKTDFSDGNAYFIPYVNAYKNSSVNLDELQMVKVSEGENQNSLSLGDVIFTSSSEKIEEVGMSSVITEAPSFPLYLNSFCFYMHLSEYFYPAFARHLFHSSQIRKQIIRCADGVTRFNLSKARFKKIEVPVPDMQTQKSIASILDKFDALVNDISTGLPAEIAARRKQYEHYRDKLLSFEEAK